MLNGRMVDAYSNMQTLKLFARDEENDRYMRQGFDIFQDTHHPLHAVHHRRARLDGASVGPHDRDDGGAERRSLAAGGNQLGCGGVHDGAGAAAEFSLGRLMTQFNGIMRNIGTIQNAAEMISQPVQLVDRPNAPSLVVNSPAIRFENIRSITARGRALSIISRWSSGRVRRSASSAVQGRARRRS
jgi:ATP-binding cassette subfamily B multidrug efflux pump